MATYLESFASIQEFGLALLHEHSEIHAVGVGSKNGEPIAMAKPDTFAVTAVVSEKMSGRQLDIAGVKPFSQVFQAQTQGTQFESIETSVVESGEVFALQDLQVPRIQRGLFGGRRPVLDTQKFFKAQ